MIHFLIILGMLTVTLATGHSHELENFDYQICDSCERAIPFEWGVTGLYLKPDIDDTHYVISSFDNTFQGSVFPKGKRHQNTTTFTPGYRIEGIFDLCRDTSELDLRFTYFNAHAKDSVSGDFLYESNGFPGFGAQIIGVYAGKAKSKNAYTFYAGDLVYKRSLPCFSHESFKFIAGLHYAFIQFKEHTNNSGIFFNHDVPTQLSNDLHRDSRFYGIGPQIGLDYHYLLSNPHEESETWSINAKARGYLLCGNIKSDLKYVTLRTGPGGVGIHNESTWRMIPSAAFECCICYMLECNCFSITVNFGYELMWYSKCVNKITGLDTAFAGDTIDVFNNFTLQGPCLGLTGSF